MLSSVASLLFGRDRDSWSELCQVLTALIAYFSVVAWAEASPCFALEVLEAYVDPLKTGWRQEGRALPISQLRFRGA